MEGEQEVTMLSSTLTNHVDQGCNEGPNNGCGIPKRSGLEGGTSSRESSKPIEQHKSMRDALCSLEGWGVQHVNQNSSWLIPSSPEPTPPPAPRMSRTSSTSREYIPASNFGGTWGDYDGTPDLPNTSTEAIATANIPAVNNNSGGQSGQRQRKMNNGPQQAPYNTGVEIWNSVSKQNGSNSRRVDGVGNGLTGQVSVGEGDHHRVDFVGNGNSPIKCARDDRNSNQLNYVRVDAYPGMWNNPQQPPQQSQWGGHPGSGSISGNITGGSGWDDASLPIPLLAPLYSPSSSTLRFQQQVQQTPMKTVGHGLTGGGGCQGPENVFNSAGGSDGWNYDHSKAPGSWEEPQLPQNDSWNKPKTPTSPNSGWVDESIFVLPNMVVSEEELEQLNFRFSNINLNDVMVQVGSQLSGASGVGVGGGRRPMDGPWGSSLDNREIGPQGRGPPGLTDDHFELALDPSRQTGMKPPLPQSIGGFFPNSIEFSDLNNIMSNNHQQFNLQGRVQTSYAMSPAQLLSLAQEIRMGVEAGYLNSQFLSRPLTQQSYYLINQLLQQIKFFLRLTQAQSRIAAQLDESRQVMVLLNNQVAAHQAIHAIQQQKQQQQHHSFPGTSGGGPGNASNNIFNRPPPGFGDNHDVGSSRAFVIMDLAMALSNYDLEDIPHHASKLGQWTTQLPSHKTEDNNPASDALRGEPTQQVTLGSTDNIWSSVVLRSGDDGWPTDRSLSTAQSVDNSSFKQPHDSSKASSSVSTNAEALPSGLVPEIQPGKPT